MIITTTTTTTTTTTIITLVDIGLTVGLCKDAI
jgi:hypothetical protein